MIKFITYKKDVTEELIKACKESNAKLIIVDELPEGPEKDDYISSLENEPIEPPYDL